MLCWSDWRAWPEPLPHRHQHDQVFPPGDESSAVGIWPVALVPWQHNPKGAADPLRAVNLDPPAMPLHDLMDDMQPQPKATDLRSDIPRTIKRIKQVRLRLGGNADAPVRDLKHRLHGSACDVHLHWPTMGTVLDRVAQQIPEHLLQPRPISGNRDRLVRAKELDRVLGIELMCHAELVHDLCGQHTQIDGLALNGKLATLEPRHVEQMVDQRVEPFGLPAIIPAILAGSPLPCESAIGSMWA